MDIERKRKRTNTKNLKLQPPMKFSFYFQHSKRKDMKTPKEILKVILTTIENVFIQNKYYASCLPATFIFWELARNYNIDVDPISGTLVYDGLSNNIHFWNVFEGEVYDPTIKVMKYMKPTLDVEKFEYRKGFNSVGMEEIQMMSLFILFQTIKTTDIYFSKAPNKLLDIRKKIHKGVTKSLK